MKVAYILNTPNAANYKVGTMILPQLEADSHGVDVLGIFFFDDNAFMLRKGDPKGDPEGFANRILDTLTTRFEGFDFKGVEQKIIEVGRAAQEIEDEALQRKREEMEKQKELEDVKEDPVPEQDSKPVEDSEPVEDSKPVEDADKESVPNPEETPEVIKESVGEKVDTDLKNSLESVAPRMANKLKESSQ